MDAELVFEHAEAGVPEHVLRGHGYFATGGERFEKGVDFFRALAFNAYGDIVALIEWRSGHVVGGHEKESVAALEGRVHDEVAGLGSDPGRITGGLAEGHEEEIDASSLLVELHGGATVSVEVQMGIDLFHGWNPGDWNLETGIWLACDRLLTNEC